jgi:hypothetical protein
VWQGLTSSRRATTLGRMTRVTKSRSFALAGLLVSAGAACSSEDRTFGGGGGGGADAGGGQTQTGGAVGTGGVSSGTGARAGSGGRGTGGNAGATGGASGSGGSASGGAAGDAGRMDGGQPDAGSGSTLIQRVQDGTLPLGERVTIGRAFVTAGRQTTGGGAFSFFLQEPEGVTTGGHPYPEYAGVGAIIRPTDAGPPTLPSLSDCIDVTGVIIDFRGLTEIDVSSWKLAGVSCGTFPRPFAVPGTTVGFDDIATDTDTSVAGLQPGTLAERYEGVLIKVSSVSAIAAPDANGVFSVSPISGGPAGAKPALQIDDFFYAEIPAAGQRYTSITGVLSDFDRYVLQPRGSADIVR